ncbi:MAG TPA: Lrp/AsnC family transcriptional regulator [Syntrophus sp. (in: bacteria)]|nr:Lrp/AsnC family transcriptional regulator [Syntrophus sp. (in: bacteria)]
MKTDRAAGVAAILQKNIPLVKRPFRAIGERLGLAEADVLRIVRELKHEGVIRKVGAILRHQPAGYVHNALILWAVPDGRTDEVGHILAGFPDVTHCYERRPPFAGKYTLFSMVHMRENRQSELLDTLMQATGITDIQILTSVEEFKKSSMEYFDEP